MNGDEKLKELAASPDAVDFIVADNAYFNDYAENNPHIAATQTFRIGYKIGYARKEVLNDLIRDLGYDFISLSQVVGLLDTSVADATGVIPVRSPIGFGLRGKGTVIGIVDTGIDYTKDVFRNPDGTTKIISIYDQTVQGDAPYSFPIGVEYTREQINAALDSDDPYSIVPQNDEVGHGTFLASVAAGREIDDFSGIAPDAELIVVKLKEARKYYREKYLIPPDIKDVYESTAVIGGIEYILAKAGELGKPVSICLGLGTNLGDHNGFSMFEEYMTHISSITGVCISTAAGNESHTQRHFLGTISQTEDTLKMNVLNGSEMNDIYLSINNNAADRISVSVISPRGESVGRIPAKANTTFTAKFITESSFLQVEYYFPVRGTGSQNTIVKIKNASPGIWSIIVHGDIINDGNIHAWLPMSGMGPEDVVFTEPDPNYTIVVPATAVGPICVGAYNMVDNTLYQNSSWGPSRLSVIQPDFVAPGVNIPGVFPDGYGVMSGTSAAAAISAGAGSLMLEWGIVRKNRLAMSTSQIRAYLIRGCTRSPDLLYPNPQWGYGMLNLEKAFEMIGMPIQIR